jgi:hypothetical protein
MRGAVGLGSVGCKGDAEAEKRIRQYRLCEEAGAGLGRSAAQLLTDERLGPTATVSKSARMSPLKAA